MNLVKKILALITVTTAILSFANPPPSSNTPSRHRPIPRHEQHRNYYHEHHHGNRSWHSEDWTRFGTSLLANTIISVVQPTPVVVQQPVVVTSQPPPPPPQPPHRPFR